MLEKVLDLKNTFEGKFIAVFMSAVLVLTMSNFAAFADGDVADASKDAPAAEQPAAETQEQPANEVPAAGTQSAPAAEQPVAPAPQGSAVGSTTESTDADKKAVEETVEHGTQAATSDGDAPTVNAPIASTEVGEAVVTFETENAYVAIKSAEDQILYGKTLTTELHKELKFVASADPGYEVSEIKAQNAASKEVVVTTQDGVSAIAAEDVDSTLVVTVKAKAVESEEPPVTEMTPITNDTKIEAGESSVENATQDAIEDVVEEGATEGENADEAADEIEATDQQPVEGSVVDGEPADETEATDQQPVEGDEPETEAAEEVVEVEADVSNPAFEDYARAGSVLVKVTAAEGVLPKGTTVQATRVDRQDVIDAVAQKVERQGKTLEDAVAIDVTLHDKDGKEIQPEGALNVCFFDANVAGDEVSVYRVSDDASQVEAIGARQADAAVQSFDVDHFTIYVVSGTGEEEVVQKAGSFRTVNVGETIVLTSRDDDGSEYYFTDDHTWTTLRGVGDVVELSDEGTNKLSVKGLKLGTVTLSHSFVYKTEAQGHRIQAVENVQITVVEGFGVEVEFLDEANKVTETERYNMPSGDLASNAPGYKGYVFERAVVGNAAISYAEQREDGVYYAVEGDLSTGVGIKLGEDESIKLQYRDLGSKVRAEYIVTGDDGVEGNRVSGFPSTVEKGGQFSFRVDTARGYEVVVTMNGQSLPEKDNTYTVSDVSDNVFVDISYKKIETVTFNPGVFTDSSYVYLYTDGEAQGQRFDFVSDEYSSMQDSLVSDKGADFNFEFTTRPVSVNKYGIPTATTWQIDSFNINDIYLAIPQTRDVGASAETVLYSDATGSCVAKLEIVDKAKASNGKYTHTYKLSISGAKENLKINQANLNNVTWREVMPLATEGIDFEGVSENGTKGLNIPYTTEDNKKPVFTFGLQEGYKNLKAELLLFGEDGKQIFNRNTAESPSVVLPGDGEETTVVYKAPYREYTLVTIRNADGEFTATFSSAQLYGPSPLKLQYFILSCERENFGVSYNVGAGTGAIADGTSYDMISNTKAVVTSAAPQAPKGSYFYGWKIANDNSNRRYVAGDVIDFSDPEVQALLNKESEGNDGSLELVAQYVDELPSEGAVPVSVDVYVMDDNGDYQLDSDKHFVVNGVMGKTVSYLNVPSYDGLVFENGRSVKSVVVNGNNSIKLYYSKQFVGSVSLDDWIYGDPAKVEKYEKTGGDYEEPTYSYKPLEGGVYSAEKPTAAGRYVVRAVWAATDTCREISATDEFAIERRPVTIAAGSSLNNAYTGKPFTVDTSTVSGLGFVDGVAYAVEFVDNVRTDVGTSHPRPKSVTLDGDILANYEVSYVAGVLEVVRADASNYGASVSINDWTYDSTFDPEGTLEATTNIEDHSEPEYAYYVSDGQEWAPVDGQPVDAGVYRVVATWAETPNYPMLKAEYDFTVEKRDLAVSDSATRAYSGQEQVLTIGADRASGLVAGETLSLDGAMISGKDVGDYTDVAEGYTWSVKKVDGMTDSSNNYDIAISGKLTIERADAAGYQASVSITGWTYDSAFDLEGTLRSSTSIEGHPEPVYTYYMRDGQEWEPVEGQPVNAGDYKVVATWAQTSNYPQLTAEQVFAVSKRSISVNASMSVPYNGARQVLDIATGKVSGLVEGEELTLDGATISGRDYGTYTKVADYTWSVVKKDGSASDSNYTIAASGKLTIDRIKVMLVSEDATKVYDGEPLQRPEVKITEGGIVNNEVHYYAIGSITEVGSAKNTIQYTVDQGNVANYDIQHDEGTLTVVPQSVNPNDTDRPDSNRPNNPVYAGIDITSPTNVVYNAQEQKWVPLVTDKNGKPLVEGRDYTVTYSNDVTNVGTVTVTIRGIGNYGGSVERTYKITPKEATIYVNDASKKFNTDDPEFSGTIEGLIEGDSLGDVSYSRTNKGEEAVNTYPSVLTAEINNLSKNYNVTVVKGDFTIEPADGNQVTITTDAEGLTKTYNGQPSSITAEADVEGSKLLYSTDEGVTWSEDNPAFTAAGTYTVHVKATHPGYEDTAPVSAMIIIEQAPVTITVADASKKYGAVDPAFAGTVEGLVAEGDLGQVAYSRTNPAEENVDVYEDVLTAIYAENPNYAVTVVNGTFEITPQAISANEPADAVYNGQEQKWAPVVTGENGNVLVEGVDYEVTYSDDATSAGTVSVTIAGKGNYAGAVDRTYEIAPAAAVIRVNDASKLYGQDDPDFTAAFEGLFGEDSLGTVSFSRINAAEETGFYEDVLTATVEDLNPNYTYTVVPGSFTIAPADGNLVHIDMTGLTKTYDGQPVSVTAKADQPGSVVLYSTDRKSWSETSPTFTNAGTYPVYAKAMNPNFTETPEAYAQVVIRRAPVTITVNNASKMYGTDDPEFTGTVEGLVAEDDLGQVAYSRTNTDQNAGVYPDVLTASYANNSNYEVKVVDGTFTITHLAISADAPNNITYNGQEQKWAPVVTDPNGNGLVPGTDYTVSYEGDATNAGTVKVTITGVGNYAGTVVRTYDITPAEAVVKVNDASKVYGEVDPAFTGAIRGLFGRDSLGEVTYYRANADQQGVDTYPGVLTATVANLNSNYTYTVEPGDFTIAPADSNNVRIDADGLTKTYDGQPVSVKAAADQPGSTLLYSTDGENWSETNPPFENAGTYTVYVKATNPNFNETAVVSANVVIGQAPLTITVNDASKVYGDDDPDFSHVVSGLLDGDDLGEIAIARSNDAEDAGKYLGVLTATVANPNPNYVYTYVPGDFTIDPASGNVAHADGSTKTYDGQLAFVTASADQPGSIMQYSIDNITWSTTTPGFTDAGTYTVYVKATNPNFNETAVVSADVVIEQAPVTITVADASKKFGAADPAFAGTVEGLVDEGDLGQVAYSRTNPTAENVDVYEDVLTAIYAENPNYAVTVVNGTFEITPQAISANEPADAVYNGQEQKWAPVVTGENGNVLVEGVDYEVTYSDDATSAGTVSVTIAGKGNYAGAVDRTYEIAPAAAVIRVNDASKLYGQDDPDFTAAFEGLFGEDSLGTVSFSRINGEEEVGSYADVLTATVEGLNPNYTYTVVPGSFTIEPADGNLVHIDAAGLTKTYDGQFVSVSAAADQPGSTLLYSLDGQNWSEENPSFANAGLYKVYVKATNPNFNETIPVSANVVINQALVTITVAGASKVYGADDPEFTGTVEGLVAEGDLGQVSFVRAGGQENVGVYANALTALFAQNPNYKVTVVNGTFEIEPQAISANEPTDVVYNGQEQKWSPIVTDESGNVLVEGVDYTVSYGGDATNAGAVTVIVTGKGNYAGTVDRVYTITPAPATITVADASKVVGAADPGFTGTVAGLVAEGDLGAIAYSRTNADEAAGTYANVLTATYTENPNYEVTVINGTFTITAAAVTPVPPAPTTPPTPTAPAPTPLPTPGTPPADNPLTPIVAPVVDALAGAAEAVIGDNETPLAQGENRETEIADNGTPLAGRDHVNCWVHLYIILGIIVTAVYGACVVLRRSLFSRKLKNYEDDLTGGDPAPGAPLRNEGGAPASMPTTVPVGATMAAGLSE